MSSEDIEIPKRMLDAWNERDLEALIALSDPEIEYVNAPDAVEPGTRRGHDEVAMVMRTQWESLGDARQEIERQHVRSDEIITEGRVSRQMPGSEARVENRILLSWTIRDGKVARLAVLGAGSQFQSALDAAGIENPL